MPKWPAGPAGSAGAKASIWALMRPTSRPPRLAIQYCTSAWSKKGLDPALSAAWRSLISGAIQFGSRGVRSRGTRMKRARSDLDLTSVRVTGPPERDVTGLSCHPEQDRRGQGDGDQGRGPGRQEGAEHAAF